jgi:hypothetical protein
MPFSIPSPLQMFDGLVAAAVRPVDGASLAIFRILFGLLGLLAVARFFVYGWIDDLYIMPTYHFAYLGFQWVQPGPAWWMYLHFALLGVLCLCITLGLGYRLSVALFFLGFTYIELIDKTTYLNHYYLVSLLSFLMIFLPMHHRWSVDAWRRPGAYRESVPVGSIWILRGMLGLVYCFAGVAKLNPDWLLQAPPLRIWLHQYGDLPVLGGLVAEPWVAYAMSWTGAIFDLTIAFWLLWGRSRPFAYAGVVGFHAATGVLFQIGIFPWLMMAGTLIFFGPNWPHRLGQRLLYCRGLIHANADRSLPAANEGTVNLPEDRIGRANWRRRTVAIGALLFAAAQIALPLRHLTYPGNVRWNEEGYRFAWRVLLNEKAGFARFRVNEPATGHSWLVDPGDYLTPLQTERMAFQPDLILATSQIIAEDFRGRGHRDIEVRADVFVSMNGRPGQRLIDPEVDLASQNPGIGPKKWILPAPAPEKTPARAAVINGPHPYR